MESYDSYEHIRKGHTWFNDMKAHLITSTTSIMHMSWDEFSETLRSSYSQCFLAGSLLHVSLSRFHYTNLVTPSSLVPDDYIPGDIDIWIYDEKGFETKEMDYEKSIGEDFSHHENEFYLKDALRVATELAASCKNVKIEGFNVIHSIRALSLKTLLDSFDLDCLRFGYDVIGDTFLLHKDALLAISSRKTRYTSCFTNMDISYDPFSEHVVILEYTADTDSSIKPKYPILYPYEEFSIPVFTSETCLVDVHPCRLLEEGRNHNERTTLSRFVYDYMWKRVRNLNINLLNPAEVQRAEELGAVFDPKTLHFYIPSDISVLKFSEYFDCPFFTPRTRKEWYNKGGILVVPVTSPKLFIHLASQTSKLWLCNGVDEGKFTDEDVRSLLYEAHVPMEDIFEILNPFYFRGDRSQYESRWGVGIMTKNSEEIINDVCVGRNTCNSLQYKFFLNFISKILQLFFVHQMRVLHRTTKYKKRGYTILVEKNVCRNANWAWIINEIDMLDSKNKIKISENIKDPSIRKYLYSFFPRSLQLNLSKNVVKEIHRNKCPNEIGSSEHCIEEEAFYRLALHPMIIDNRIFRLAISGFEQYRTKLRIPEDSPLTYLPLIFLPQPNHMKLPHVIYCTLKKNGKERKYFLRVHDENTFYSIMKNAVEDFWSNDKQYNLLKKMLKIARKERNHFSSSRENTFALWSILGPVKDMLNYVIYDTILRKVYIVSVSSFINCYCAKSEEHELHKLKNGFHGFDCIDDD